MEKKFVIVADSTCDLNNEIREKFDVDYIAGTFTYPDGKEEYSFLDWADCKNIPNCTEEIFYSALKKNPDGFTTAPPGVQVLYNRFESYIKQGLGVLAMAISSAISGTYSFMAMARKQILENYPDAEIYCVDSKRYGSANGLLVMLAAEMRNQGKSLKETAEYVENNKLRLHQAGTLDDLKFLAKKGRINSAKAFFGTLVGVKPLGDLDANGMVTVIGKVKGEKAALNVNLAYMEAIGEDLSNQIILVAQSLRRSQAEEYKRLIEEKFKPKAVYLTSVYPMDGINMGPGLSAAYFLGKPVSEGLTTERETLNKIIESSR